MKFQGKEYELEGWGDQLRRNEPRKRRNLWKLKLVMPLVLLKGLNLKRKGARNLEGLRRVEYLRVESLWKSLRTCKMRKVISLGVLYRGQNWVGVISLKIQGEISTVESLPHRWMWGTKCHLEQLITPRGLRSVSDNYKARKTTLLRV